MVKPESRPRPESREDAFSDFFREHEMKLRQSLSAALGSDLGKDSAAEALAYGWEHWDRVREMENPVGYLYKVGRDHGRRVLRRRSPVLLPVQGRVLPMVEPALPKALASLSERQRTTVMLVHSFEWTLSEVAEVLGLSKSSVRNHLQRGMDSLRRDIGGAE
jgi:RNA polymerase sigma-70 factor (ECF subfamily)